MRVKVEGLRELDATLATLSKAAGKAALRRAGTEALQRMARAMRQAAPRDDYDLYESIDVSTKLSPRQEKLARRLSPNERSSVEVHAGAGHLPQAHLQEFGTFSNPPQPYVRPAWDGGKEALLDRTAKLLAEEIEKAAQRAARKAARLAGR